MAAKTHKTCQQSFKKSFEIVNHYSCAESKHTKNVNGGLYKEQWGSIFCGLTPTTYDPNASNTPKERSLKSYRFGTGFFYIGVKSSDSISTPSSTTVTLLKLG